MAVIKTSGLTKYYGSTPGIIDLDLEVREGEVFGFIGPNGAGKSTLGNVLAGREGYEVTEGEVELGLSFIAQQREAYLEEELKRVVADAEEAQDVIADEAGDEVRVTARRPGPS